MIKLKLIVPSFEKEFGFIVKELEKIDKKNGTNYAEKFLETMRKSALSIKGLSETAVNSKGELINFDRSRI